MTILHRLTDGGGPKDGLEGWRQIALEMGKLGYQSLLNKQTWLLTPSQAKNYSTLGEMVRNYEHQNSLLNIADREGLYGVDEKVRRNTIVNRIIGNRPEMRELYDQVCRITSFDDMLAKIYDHCRHYEVPAGSKPAGSLENSPETPNEEPRGGAFKTDDNSQWLNSLVTRYQAACEHQCQDLVDEEFANVFSPGRNSPKSGRSTRQN